MLQCDDAHAAATIGRAAAIINEVLEAVESFPDSDRFVAHSWILRVGHHIWKILGRDQIATGHIT